MMRYAPLIVVAALLGACHSGPDLDAEPFKSLTMVPTPAAPGSGEPNLAVAEDGAVYLSWLEPSDEGDALRFSEWEGAGWGPARTIVDRPDLFVNWADFPSLAALPGGTLVAHWLETSGAGPATTAYDIGMALSLDGGESWGEEITPHQDSVLAEHGFVSLVPMDDRFAALWLDGRATPDGDPMTLRFTTIEPSGTLGDPVLVDASVCDCCQTAMTTTSDGLVAAYRNRTADEVRDIYVTRYVDGAWTEGHPVHEDGWVIAGCPVNGPAIAASGDTVVVAWFTAAGTGDTSARSPGVRRRSERNDRVLAAFSTDGGATFGDPVRIDEGSPLGRVDVLAPVGGVALVSWLERVPGGAEIRVRQAASGAVGPTGRVAGTGAERASGFPRMTRLGDRVVFAWTIQAEESGIRTAVLQPGSVRETP